MLWWSWLLLVSVAAALVEHVSGSCGGYEGLDSVTVATYDQLACAFAAHVPNITANASISFPSEIAVSWSQTYTLSGAGGAVLSSAADGRLFNLSNSYELILRNLTMRGGTGSAGLNGGLVYASNSSLVVEGCRLSGARAQAGGAIYAEHLSSILVLNSSVTNNTAASAGGGVFAADSELVICGSAVSNNVADQGAGLFLDGGNSSLLLLTLANNVALSSGGGLVCDQRAMVAVNESAFTGNVATSVGGALSAQGGCSVVLDHSRISNNTVLTSGSPISIGGGANCQYGSISATRSDFIGNSASAGSDVYAFQCMLRLLFVRVHGSSTGDGSVYSAESDLIFEDSAIGNNRASVSTAGILCVDSTACDIVRSNFSSNSAASLGVISVDSGAANISDCLFVDNISDGLAGALYVINAPLVSVVNCLFQRNIASTYGGAIAAETNSAVRLTNCSFITNSAVAGGALYAFHRTNLALEQVMFLDNNGSNAGGAIYLGDHVSLQGRVVTLVNCSSATGGGIYATYLSTIDLMGLVALGNSAGYAGGAISVFDGVSVALTDALFKGNKADLGGAMSVEYDSTAAVTHSRMLNNTATSYGGAVFVISSAVFSATSCGFNGNDGGFGGGGIFLQTSLGNLTHCWLQSNSALSGAGIYLLGSTADISFSRFDSNGVACVQGGAVFGAAATLMSSENNYSANVATNGGVLALSGSSLSSLNDRLTSCVAKIGGCIYAIENSTIAIDGSWITSNNVDFSLSVAEQVYMDGGRLAMSGALFDANFVTTGGALSLYSVEAIISNCIFSNNHAASSSARGAAIHVACSSDCDSSLQLTVEIANCTFANNSAALGNGGALFVMDYPGTVLVEGGRFEANNATFGGAVASSGSVLQFTSTAFIDNTARSGGGAVFWNYADVEDVTLDSSCEDIGNSAGYGPFRATSLTKLNASFPNASQVSGVVLSTPIVVSLLDFYSQTVTQSPLSASLDTTIYCSVFNNTGIIKGSTIVAAAEGVALFAELILIGTPGRSTQLQFSAPLSSVDAVSLSVYFRECVSGEITNDEGDGLATCVNCTLGTYSFYPTDSSCSICPANAFCPGGNVLDVSSGYWRVDQVSATVLECAVSHVCRGGTNTSSQCATGQSGPYCSVCEEGYTQNQNGECYSCSSATDLATEVMTTVIFLAVVGAAALLIKYKSKLALVFGGMASRMNKVAANRKFHTLRVKAKIVIAFCQIVYQMGPALGIVFPANYSTYISYYSILQLNLVSLPNVGCMVSTNFYDSLTVSTIAPFVIFAAVAIYIQLVALHAMRQNERNPYYTTQRARRDTINAAFAISYFVVVNVSTKIFQVFQCETFDDGQSYLVADLSINCNAPERSAYVTYGILMIFLYPIGIPLVYALVLFRNRSSINPDWRKVVDVAEKRFVSNRVIQAEKIKVRNTVEEIDNIKLLFDSFVPKRWYFELFDCARRLLLGAVPVLIFRGSSLQIIIVLLVSLCSVATFMFFKPYIHAHDNNLAILAQWSITFIVISAMTINVEALGDGTNGDGLGAVLIVVNLTVLVAAVGTAFANSKEKGDEGSGQDRDPETGGGAAAAEGGAQEEDDLGSDDEDEDRSIDSDDEDVPAPPPSAAAAAGSRVMMSSSRGSGVMEIELNPMHGGKVGARPPAPPQADSDDDD